MNDKHNRRKNPPVGNKANVANSLSDASFFLSALSLMRATQTIRTNNIGINHPIVI